MVTPIAPGPNAPRAAVLRHRWAQTLDSLLKSREITRKQFRALLANEGLDVSLQTISNWRTGKNSPKPEHQVVIAKALRVPASFIFSLDEAA